MKPRLLEKIARIRANPSGRDFILADAKDPDMAFGIPSPGRRYPHEAQTSYRTLAEFHEQVRDVVRQGIVDLMLTSVSTMSVLAGEQLFDTGDVTPAVRLNDTTDIWCVRGGNYRHSPSLPFATAWLDEARSLVDLGLYSITFNNDLLADRESLLAFKAFRAEAERCELEYFLEVFAPNTDAGLARDNVPAFVNDHIVRMLAGVPPAGRPVFLKMPYFGPRWLEELAAYDPTQVVGILGGDSGTTCDAFTLLSEAQRHGARAAIFGRKIKDAEAPLAIVALMREIVDGNLSPPEAVRAYHGELQKHGIPPKRSCEEDQRLTAAELQYMVKA